MLAHRMFNAAIALFLTVGISTAQAQSLATEEAKINSLQKQLSETSGNLTAINQKLSANQKEIDAANQADSPEKEALDAAKSDVAEAEKSYQADPSPTHKSRLSQARFKQVLAERDFEKSNGKLQDLLKTQSDLQSQSKQLSQRQTELTNQLSQQQRTVSRLRTEQLDDERAMREQQQVQIEAQRKQAAASQAEVERLKALLAEKDSREKAAAIAAASAVTAGTATATVAASKSASAASMAAPASITKSASTASAAPAIAKTTPTVTPTNTEPSSDTGIRLLVDSAAISAEKKRFQTAIAGLKEEKRVNRILHIKDMDGKTTSIKLDNFGNEQYRGRNVVRTGSYTFVIGFYKWQQAIPATLDGKTLDFFFNNSGDKPALVLFAE